MRDREAFDLDVDTQSSGRTLSEAADGTCCPLDLSTLYHANARGIRSIGLAADLSADADAPVSHKPGLKGQTCCVTHPAIPDLHPQSCSNSTAANDTPSEFDGDCQWREEDGPSTAHRRRSSSCLYSEEQEAVPSSPGPRTCDLERLQQEVLSQSLARATPSHQLKRVQLHRPGFSAGGGSSCPAPWVITVAASLQTCPKLAITQSRVTLWICGRRARPTFLC
jgi:hypothetical protein